MYNNVLFMLFFLQIGSGVFAMINDGKDVSARDKMYVCFQNVKKGKLHDAYSLFVSAISDKDDDPGYYPELSNIGKLCLPEADFEEMWNEYGITDYARGVFFKVPEDTLEWSLQAVVNK